MLFSVLRPGRPASLPAPASPVQLRPSPLSRPRRYYNQIRHNLRPESNNHTLPQHSIIHSNMDDIDLDVKLRELEESVKCRRERRREQKLEMEQELEKSLKKESSRSQDRGQSREMESEKKPVVTPAGTKGGQGNLVTNQEEKYIKELCETEKRIRQLESVISDLNFELEKIDIAETTGLGIKDVDTGGRTSTDL